MMKVSDVKKALHKLDQTSSCPQTGFTLLIRDEDNYPIEAFGLFDNYDEAQSYLCELTKEEYEPSRMFYEIVKTSGIWW